MCTEFPKLYKIYNVQIVAKISFMIFVIVAAENEKK